MIKTIEKIFFVFFLLGTPLFADQQKIEALLQSYSRPTMSQVKEAFGERLANQENPYIQDETIVMKEYYSAGRRVESIRSMIKNNGPEFIAQLDAAYPGATIMSIGRDAVFVSDMFDAFYLSQNQKGRALRFEASGGMARLASPEFIIRYFQQFGYDYTDPKKIKSMPPLVLVDASWYRYSSQSYAILNVLYKTYIHSGGKFEALFPKLAFFSTLGETTHYKVRFKQDFLSQLRNFIEQGFYAPLLCLDFESLAEPEPVKWTHFTYWHDKFSKFHETEQGITSHHLGVHSLENRKQVLGVQFDLLQAMENPVFLENVKSTAKKYFNHDFQIAGPQSCSQSFGNEGNNHG